MRKATIALALSVALATPAMADSPRPKGCNGYGIGTFFDEDDQGNNCPPSNWEKQVGNLGKAALVALIFAGIAHKTGKADIFPLKF